MSKEICMLAKKLTDKNKPPYPFTLQPKLDGIRGIFNHPLNPKDFTSRQQNPLMGIPKLVELLNTLSLPEGEDTILDGEITIPKLTFNEMSGVIRRERNNVSLKNEAAVYTIFDFVSNKPYHLRRIKLEKWFNQLPLSVKNHIGLINETKISSLAQECITTEHYCSISEGIILRKIMGAYDQKRSSNLLKWKPFKYLNVELVSLIEGSERLNDSLGSFEVREPKKHKTFKVGSGLTDAQRELWWGKPPKLGSHLIIKYQELSEYGIPRFPIFKEFV